MCANTISCIGLPNCGLDTIQEVIGDQVAKIIPLDDNIKKEQVQDFTYKYIVISHSGNQFVLIVSNPHFPLMVSTAVRQLQIARIALCSNSRDVIETPLAHGFLGKISYALWRRRIPLSSNRYYKFAQKKLLALKISHWLCTAATESLKAISNKNELHSGFIGPLQMLSANLKLGDDIRSACKLASLCLINNELVPVHTLQHGDLWLGNVLITNFASLMNPTKRGFIIIDWAGSKTSGYPFVDLISFLISCNISPEVGARFTRSMAYRISCNPSDAPLYLLCALGKMSQELNKFPEYRFIQTCNAMWEYISKIQNLSAKMG